MPYKDPLKKLEHQREYRKEQKEAINARERAKYAANKDEIKKRKALNDIKYKDKKKIYIKKYNSLPDKKLRRSELRKINWTTNPNYKLGMLVRSRVNKAIKEYKKTFSSIELLGCSVIEAKLHLEKQFVSGMSWDNHGEWHIDHIKPLSAFDLEDKAQLLTACHYSNLQPLWAKDNLSKGKKL